MMSKQNISMNLIKIYLNKNEIKMKIIISIIFLLILLVNGGFIDKENKRNNNQACCVNRDPERCCCNDKYGESIKISNYKQCFDKKGCDRGFKC